MNKIEALNEKALEAAVLLIEEYADACVVEALDLMPPSEISDDHRRRNEKAVHDAMQAIRAYLTASDAEREPVSAAETTADTLQRFPKIMGALAESEREPVAASDVSELVERLGKFAGTVRINNGSFSDIAHEAATALTDLEAENARLRKEQDALIEAAVIAERESCAFAVECHSGFGDPETIEACAQIVRDRFDPALRSDAIHLSPERCAELEATEARLAEALKALDAIIERSNNDPLGTSKVNDMRRIAEDAARRVREGGEL